MEEIIKNDINSFIKGKSVSYFHLLSNISKNQVTGVNYENIIQRTTYNGEILLEQIISYLLETLKNIGKPTCKIMMSIEAVINSEEDETKQLIDIVELSKPIHLKFDKAHSDKYQPYYSSFRIQDYIKQNLIARSQDKQVKSGPTLTQIDCLKDFRDLIRKATRNCLNIYIGTKKYSNINKNHSISFMFQFDIVNIKFDEFSRKD